jgi:hypothetical protein
VAPIPSHHAMAVIIAVPPISPLGIVTLVACGRRVDPAPTGDCDLGVGRRARPASGADRFMESAACLTNPRPQDRL